MASTSSNYVKQIHIAVDFLLLNFAFFDGYFLKFGHLNLFNDSKYFVFILYFNIVWFSVANSLGSYDFNPYQGIESVLKNIFRIFGYHIMLVSLFWVFIKGYYYSREQLLTVYVVLFVLMLGWKMGLYYFLKLYRKQWFKFKSVVIVGYGESSIELSSFFEKFPEYGYRFLGYFHDKTYLSTDIIGRTEDMESFIENIHVDEIFCSMPDSPQVDMDNLFEFADNNLIRLRILPDFRGFTNRNLNINLYEGIPILSFRKLPLDDVMNRFSKRFFDVAFSLTIIVFVLSWLLPILAIIIKIQSPGPVFFKQKRTGKDNKDFWCLKFRSMYVNKDSDSRQARKGDKRITPIGNFIRKTSLDEFPQFFNVFLGQMSIVGPRPHMLKHTEEYSRIIKKYMVRHFVKPGITGLAQTKGYRGETTDSKMMQGRVKYDIFYIENWSFLLDLKIVAVTALNVIKGEENAG